MLYNYYLFIQNERKGLRTAQKRFISSIHFEVLFLSSFHDISKSEKSFLSFSKITTL